jgi:hypothetical protein
MTFPLMPSGMACTDLRVVHGEICALGQLLVSAKKSKGGLNSVWILRAYTSAYYCCVVHDKGNACRQLLAKLWTFLEEEVSGNLGLMLPTWLWACMLS